MAEGDSYMGKGLVKEVQSGDCVTILVSGQKGKEVTLTLASLDAPRLSRRSGDAPFAQQSREFLRNKCAGKMVTFKVEYEVPTIGRTFGTIFVDGSDVSFDVVEAGFARVKDARGGDCSGSYDDLVALQENAKAAGAGLWTNDKTKIAPASVKVRHAGDSDVSDEELASIFRDIEDSPVQAIVEYIRDGSNMRVLLPDYNVVVPFVLAGVICPSNRGKGIRRADGSYDDSAAKPEPFAAMAKQFVEARLLSRRVNIRCLGGPPLANLFYGKVEHPKGDISAEVLRAGLGRVNDLTLKYTPNRAALRAAETQAKEARKRVWKNFTPLPEPDRAVFQGTVVEVNSGDTVTVEDASTGEEHRVSLSSIRVPFGGTRDGSRKAEPFAAEAREALRQLLIGKKVTVSVEYARRGRDKDGNERTTGPQRRSATVTAGKTNAALELVKRGLASVIRHRQDEPRSDAYDALSQAEHQAAKSKVGIHGNKSKASTPPNDVTRDSQKAKHFLSFLTRPGENIHQGVVEFCFNSSRFKVHIPKQNVIVAVNLIGVSTPRGPRAARNGQNAEPGEPYAEEVLKFVKRAVLNRNITLEIEDADERGAALASVFATIDGNRTNLNLELLKRGYGRVVRWSADKSKLRDQLYDTSDIARDARIGVWENYVPKSRNDEGEGETNTVVGTQHVHVSHIDDASSFYITLDSEETSAALAELQTAGPTLAAPEGGVERKGTYAINFNGEWCRVRVDHVDFEEVAAGEGEEPTKKPVAVDISYLDFGNKESNVPAEELLALPAELAKLPASATKAHLAFVKAPGLQRPAGDAAGALLHELTWGKDLVAELLPATDNGVPAILYNAADAAALTGGDDAEADAEAAADDDADAEADAAESEGAGGSKKSVVSINEEIVKAGLARLRRPRRSRFGGRSPQASAAKGPHASLQKTLGGLEKAAHNAHVGMWRYGDPGDSDEN